MSKKNIDHSVESRVCFEELEEWVREQIQFYVQELLEDVYQGAQYVNGVPVNQVTEEKAA